MFISGCLSTVELTNNSRLSAIVDGRGNEVLASRRSFSLIRAELLSGKSSRQFPARLKVCDA